jgi:hypothetical protein
MDMWLPEPAEDDIQSMPPACGKTELDYKAIYTLTSLVMQYEPDFKIAGQRADQIMSMISAAA